MARKPEILVIGMGAVGTMAAYALDAGHQANVTAVLRSNYDLVSQQGFTIDSIDHGKITGWRPPFILKEVPDLRQDFDKSYDYIVLATKNTPDAGPDLPQMIEPAVKPGHTGIVLMQNGLNIELPFQRHFPNNAIISSTQMIGTNETSPAHILHNESDISHVGLFARILDTSSASASASTSTTDRDRDRDPSKTLHNLHLSQTHTFITLYNASGRVCAHFDPHVRTTRWRKLIYNASYNSASAILGLDVTRMRTHSHIIDDLVAPIMREIITIAAADGVHLTPTGSDSAQTNTSAQRETEIEALVIHFVTIDKLSSWFVPSMGQDAARGKALEVENIVGEPVRVARKWGVPCPTLTVVYAILRGLQAKIRHGELRGGEIGLDMKG